MKKNRSINAFNHSGAAFKAALVLLFCALAFSACGRPKLSAKYGAAAPEKKQNSAGTLSVILPANIAETEQKKSAAGTGGTGKADEAAGNPAHLKPAKASGDIVEIKEKMFIAQTNDVYLNPEDYMGKTIKLEGLFKTETGYDEQAAYCFVLRYGPGCCGFDGNAGFEVAWDEAGP
ncbi:MAG: hypothetical protein LBH15_02245, partial [Treponema sp.]|nr:hypothetical protein [Treponema sp.]